MPTEAEARKNLQVLLDDYRKLTEEDKTGIKEATIVSQFIRRLLGDVLGWPVDDPKSYHYEFQTLAGRPDITLELGRGARLFVEAKRFGIIKELRASQQAGTWTVMPQQLSLPGMATDRTREEQQAINYAFENNGTWAILTNFERLRLFNARRDWLVLSFERPGAYLDDFDLLWQLAYSNILDGSLDRLSDQRWTIDVDTEYLALINEYREKLAKDIVAGRENNPWAFEEDGSIKLALLRKVVQRFLDRLVIVRFAEDHLVLGGRPLYQFYQLRDNFYRDPMQHYLGNFFRHFDKDHNSALFASSLVDQAVFSDEVLLPLIEELYRARYRAMPADIIGNTYEQYLGKTLALDNGSVVTRDNLETRKKQGSYYTPQVIVRYIVDHSLGRYLYGTENGRPDGVQIEGESRKTSEDIQDLRILDSACGSGSFLIYAYQVLAEFYQLEMERLNQRSLDTIADMRKEGKTDEIDIQIAIAPYRAEIERLSEDYPRMILERHIYGVDLDPQAAEIAVVNLIMRAMERRNKDKRLPLILNQNVKVGNGLIGLRPDDARLNEHAEALARLRGLRQDLINTAHTDPEHARVQAALETERDKLYSIFAPDYASFTHIERVRPFHWAIEFPEVFVDEKGALLENAGFDIVIGNPPWEIVKPDLREFYAQFDENIESRLTRKKAETRIKELIAEDPRRELQYDEQKQLIEESALYFRRIEDYTRQGRGDTATHKLFLERMYGLLQATGRLGYVVPSGIYTDLGTKDLREMLFRGGQIEYLYGLANVRKFFPEVDSRFKFSLLGFCKEGETDQFPVKFMISHAEWPQITDEKDSSALLAEVLQDQSSVFEMSAGMVERFSPDSLSVMEFQTQRDYQVTEIIYGDRPLLGDDVENAWNVKLTAELHMTSDRNLFNTLERGLPLYEGKMIHQYDAFFAEPSYWLDEAAAIKRLERKTGLDYQRHRLAFRDIARSTDERTLISTVLPQRVFCNNKTPIVQVSDAPSYDATILYLCAVFNSFMLDFVIRQKVATTLNFFYMYTLPIPRLTEGNPYFDAIVPRAARLTCTRQAFADLWQTVMEQAWVDPATHSVGTRRTLSEPESNPPIPAIDPATRQQLRDEIDALVAHLYGLTRDEFDHILGTFPLVFPDDEQGQAKRERLLHVYDTINVG